MKAFGMDFGTKTKVQTHEPTECVILHYRQKQKALFSTNIVMRSSVQDIASVTRDHFIVREKVPLRISRSCRTFFVHPDPRAPTHRDLVHRFGEGHQNASRRF